MAEKIQHPYECLCKGHVDGSKTFLAAPPEWYAEKGLDTPKNCPSCKSWMKSQADEQRACACGSRIRISHKRKISHHKKVGPYEPIEECGPCSEGKRPPKAFTTERPSREKRQQQKRKERKTKFSDLKGGAAKPRMIIVDKAYYESVVTRNITTGQRETRAVHLEHHLPGSEHSWTSPEVSAQVGLARPKSPTSFGAENQTLAELLEFASEYMASTDPEHIREYRDGNLLIRITFVGDHDGLEKTVLKEKDGLCEVITSHDNVTVRDVMKQSWYK